MALVNYSFTALLESDAAGQNTAANQAVSVKLEFDNGLATIYSDAAGTTPIAQPGAVTDANGVLSFWVLPGYYKIESATRVEYAYIDDGSRLSPDTLAYAQSQIKQYKIGEFIKPQGRATKGDGGAATWEVIAKTAENGFDIVAGDATRSLQLIVPSILSIEVLGGVVGDVTLEMDRAIALQNSTGCKITTATVGEYIYTTIHENKVDYIGEGSIVRSAGKARWWTFESSKPTVGKILNNTARDKFRTLLAQSARKSIDDVTYICVGDSTRASYDQIIFKGMRNALIPLNVETILSAKSGQTAADWGNATGSGIKWDDLIGSNASTYDAIVGTGSTTLLDVCLGVNDISNDTTDNVQLVKDSIKAGIDSLIAVRSDLLVNLTQPNRLRNQGLKTSKLIQAYKELSEENNWSMTETVKETIPTVTDAFNRSELYFDDTHPNEAGQRLILRSLLKHIIPNDEITTALQPNSSSRFTQGAHTDSQNIEDAFSFIHIANNSGWEQLTLWKFDANTFFFADPTGAASASRSFKPLVNTESVFPADNGCNLYHIYDGSPPVGGGTWTRTRKFTFGIKDTAPLAAMSIGSKVPLNPALIQTFPNRAFVHANLVKKPAVVLERFFEGLPTAGGIFARYMVTQEIDFHYGFKLSGATSRVAATAQAVFTIRKNATQIGLITFAAAANTGTFTSSPFALVNLVPGDILDIANPLIQDTTLADVGITLFSVNAR